MRNHGSRLGLACMLIGLFGCSKVKSLIGQGSDAAPAGSAAAPVASAAPAERANAEGSVCTASDRKVWGKWANRRTGLTPARIDGRLVIGVAIGNTPQLLVFDGASGKLQRLNVPDGAPLAKDLKAPDQRDLHRVTPAKTDSGGLTAYADYRDEYRDKRRRIACGPVESTRPLLVFDGKPLIDKDAKKPEDKKEEPKVADADAGAPKLAARPRLKLPGIKALAPLTRAAPDAAAAPAATPAAPATAPPSAAPPSEAKKTVTELRDCRTMVDPGGAVWAVGTELRGEQKEGGQTKWSMRAFVAPDGGRGYVQLHNVPFAEEPKKLSTFETPVGAEVEGGHVVFARYQGSLFGWSLGRGFRPSGALRVYRSGYPSMPHLIRDGSEVRLLGSQKTSGTAYELVFAELGKKLPASLTKIQIDGADASVAEPTLARAGEQRWLSYQAGSRREGRMVVIPVDAQMRPNGKPYDVTLSGSSVYESAIFGLGDGKLLAVYIQNADPGAELVSEVLSCTVRS